MKKIICGIISAVILASLSIGALGADSSIAVSNSDKEVSYTYSSADKTGESAKSIKALMTSLSELTNENKAVQTLTVKSDSADGTPVSLKLRLSDNTKTSQKAGATMSPASRDALSYYDISVTDADGEPVISDENDGELKNGSRDILLGTMNKLSASETKTYTITISVNRKVDKSATRRAAQALDWIIVADKAIAEVTPSPSPAETLKPVDTTAPEPSAKASEDKNGVISLTAGEYLCGTDIKQGRYVMSGSGRVKVLSNDGTVKTTVALKNKSDSANGVEEYVIQLSDGERIVTDSNITLKPHSSASQTPKPSPTASAKAKATPTPKAAGTTDKTNPKTGDAAPIAIVLIIGVLSVSAVVFMEIKKRKEY